MENTASDSETTEQTVNQQTDASKKEKDISYPFKNFEATKDFVAKIYDELGHNVFHSREQIAAIHNLAPNSTKQPISAAQLFGLLEIKHGVGYKTTDLYAKIQLPSNDEEEKQSVLESLKKPPLYNNLLSQYEKSGILPNNNGLTNTIIRNYGYDAVLANKVAKDFTSTLKSYGFLDDKNILRLSHFPQTNDGTKKNVTTEVVETSTLLQVPAQAKKEEPGNDEIVILIPLKEKGRARLILPEGYDDKDLKRIAKFVDALKESED